METPTGAIVPLLTPLRTGPRTALVFDPESFENLWNYVSPHAHVFSLGLTGEEASLPLGEKEAVIEKTVELAQQGDKPYVLVGVTAGDFSTVRALASLTRGSAIDALVVQPSRIGGGMTLDRFDALYDASEKPVFLYINDQSAKYPEVTPQELAQLATAVPWLRGAKISTSAGRFREYAGAFPVSETAFPLYIGNAMDMFEPDMRAVGVVTGPGNLHPQHWGDAWNLLAEGKNANLRKALFSIVKDAYTSMPGGKNTVGALKYLSYCQGRIASPACMTPISAMAREHLGTRFGEIEDLARRVGR